MRFKEYNPEVIKEQLPAGHSPLESMPVLVDFSRNATIKVHGFANDKEANDFVNYFAPQFISACKLTKGMKNAVEYEHQIIAPYQLAPLFSAHGYACEVCVKNTLYGTPAIPHAVYRQLGKEKYVQDLFDKGSFQISTFKRCRVLESDLRRDKYELRNIVEICDGSLKMETDVQFDDNLLLLCTSTSPEDLEQNKSGMIKITNVFGFISEITKTLTEMGYLSAEIVQGPCKYNDKVIQINGKGFLSNYMSRLDASEKFDGATLASFIRDKAENDVIFTKPFSFEQEREYRIVWKLVAPFDDDKLTITNPNLGKYCERLKWGAAMPTKTSHGKFELDPAYDEEQDLAKRIDDVRAFLEKELAAIDDIEDITFQLICIFAMIDCLAQERANYPQEPWAAKNAFCQFVLKHQKQCNYLEAVEPITLYYRVEDLIDEVVPIPGFPPEKEVSIDDLGYLYGERVKDIIPRGKSEEILSYIERKEGTDFAAKMEKDHRLISLLYRMRSKAVHEMSGLGEVWRLEKKDSLPTEPYYRDVGRGYVQGDEWVSDNVIELVIPNIFARNILADCINGYLSDCRDTKRFPFSNNHMTRKHKLSWYDK